MKMKTKSASQQRAEQSRMMTAAVYLELSLRQLAHEALAGNLQSMREFQQDVQLAPPEMRGRINDYIEQLQEPHTDSLHPEGM